MDSRLPSHVVEEFARRDTADRFAKQEAEVREALITHVEKAIDVYLDMVPDGVRHIAELAVDALADFVDSGHEFVEPWHGRATSHG